MTDSKVVVRFKPIDLITLAFCAWMLLLISIGWNRVHHPVTHFLNYLTIFAAILGLMWLTEIMKVYADKEGTGKAVIIAYKVMTFLRSYYPVLLFLYFFESVSATNRVFFHDWLDPFFLKIDRSIFGYLPSMEWGIRHNNIWLKELFHFAYFCYYPMIIGLPVLFYLKRRKAIDEVVFVLSFVFYICYFIYSWLPVIGGRFFPLAMQFTRQSDGGIFTAIMAHIYIYSPHLGGAFPSSHIAIALVLSMLAYKYFRKLGYILLGITFFLSIATVYCHYHWFIDAVFGILTGLMGYWLAQVVFAKLSEKL
jgi:membrane-associated phospholipid phosphatase